MINRFFSGGFLCSIVLYVFILITLSGRHPCFTSFTHFKKKHMRGWTILRSVPTKNQNKGLWKWRAGMVVFCWHEKRKQEEKWNDRGHEMHSFTLSLFHFLPQGLGVSCNLSIGFSLVILSLVLHHLSLAPLSFSLSSASFPLAPLPAGFPELIISVSAACLWRGSLTGRKAGWWPQRSWVTQVRCRQCPWGACVSYLCGMWAKRIIRAVFNSEHRLTLYTLGKDARQVCLCRPSMNSLAIILKTPNVCGKQWHTKAFWRAGVTRKKTTSSAFSLQQRALSSLCFLGHFNTSKLRAVIMF